MEEGQGIVENEIILREAGNTVMGQLAHKIMFNKPIYKEIENRVLRSKVLTGDVFFVYEVDGTLRAAQPSYKSAMRYMNSERILVYSEKSLQTTEGNHTEADELVNEIAGKIKAACTESKYKHLCMRVETDEGMAYVVNRCISMMSSDKLKLSTCLANLESEFEGIS